MEKPRVSKISKMVKLLVLLALSFSFCDVSDAKFEKKLPSAVVVGTVFCDTCFQEKLSNTSFFISGAIVAVECKNGGSKPSFREEAKTDEKGEFRVYLPVSVSKHKNTIDQCFVRLIQSGAPHCAAVPPPTSHYLRPIKTIKPETHIFSAGFFAFKPLKRPDLCNQKPSIKHSNRFDEMKLPDLSPPLDYPGLPAPIQNPTVPNVPRIYENLPLLPLLPGLPPLPKLPPLPPLPGFPKYPPEKAAEDNPTTVFESETPSMSFSHP